MYYPLYFQLDQNHLIHPVSYCLINKFGPFAYKYLCKVSVNYCVVFGVVNLATIFKVLAKKYPFISLLLHGNDEYIGIIQNSDSVVTSFYNFGMLKTKEEKQLFLTLADEWWGESNRTMPINIFLKKDWAPFKYTLCTFITKDTVIAFGPVVSLQELAAKRTKKRSIILVRKMN